MTDEVRDLLAAIRAAADPAGLDPPAMVHRLVSIHVRVDSVLAANQVDNAAPGEPAMTPQVMASAATALRELGARR